MATPTTPSEDQAFEVTFPPPPEEPAPVPAPAPKPRLKQAALPAGLVVLLSLVGYSTYALGYNQGRAHVATGAAETTAPIKVPEGATIIAQCAIGRGTQYVLPSNIPHGPVYNVYKGNVIGLEYMIGSDDLADSMSFYDLPLYGRKYDHLDIGLVSEGHSGYPERHYHVDVYTVSRATSEAITCK